MREIDSGFEICSFFIHESMEFHETFGNGFESFQGNEQTFKIPNHNSSLLQSQNNLNFPHEIPKMFNKKRIFLEKYYGETSEYNGKEIMKEEKEDEEEEHASIGSSSQSEIFRKKTMSYYENEDSLNRHENETNNERFSSEASQNNAENPFDFDKYFSSENYKYEFIPQLSSLNLENETMKASYFSTEKLKNNESEETYSNSPNNKQSCKNHIFYNEQCRSNNNYNEEELQNSYDHNYSDFPYMNDSYTTQDVFCSQFWSVEEPLDLSVPKDETTINNFNLTSEYDENPSEFSLNAEFADQNSWLKKIKTGTRSRVRSPKSWEFLLRLLMDPKSNPSMIRWEDETTGTFRLVQKDEIAKIWGMRSTKHKDGGLSYDNFARNLRYHYKTKMLVPVSEKHLVYKFSNEVMEKKHSFVN
ncbi:UNVERIFIED_CONTAM: hypothetical protein RMT77_008376 [Armadillidium vulgare]